VLLAGVVWRMFRLGIGFLRLRRLRRDSTPARMDEAAEALRADVAPRAELRWTNQLAQPVAFGWRRPLVLLPRSLTTLSPEARQAVLCHELLHVARRDWAWIVAEDLVRAVMWFHPGVWWLLDQVQVSREQVVDALAVRRTGARKPYMQALLWFAETPPAAALPATAFLHRRHLRTRMQHLAQEPHMSLWRLVITATAALGLIGGASRAVVSALPLDLESAGLAQGPQAQLEIRLAEMMPAAGLTAATVDGTGQTIYLETSALVTAADVAQARLLDAGSGRFSVDVTFRDEASQRMSRATAAHVGKPVAILLDGRVVAAPVVRSPIGRSAGLTGNFTRPQAEAIVNRLPPRIIGASLRPAPWASLLSGRAAGADQERPFSSKDEGVTLPSVVTEVKPVYTQAAKDARIQGDVQLKAVVKADGTVGDVTVTKSLDKQHGLDQAAVDATRQWKFKPGTKSGQAVPVEVDMMMRFTLK
jgi:TonB family protein